MTVRYVEKRVGTGTYVSPSVAAEPKSAASERVRAAIDTFAWIDTKLSPRDAALLADLFENPLPPDAALQRARQRYERSVKRDDAERGDFLSSTS